MNQPELGVKIAELRNSRGFTQQELADKCNINIRTIQRIELGKVQPRVYTVKQLLNALEFSYEDVFESVQGNGSEKDFGQKLKSFFLWQENLQDSDVRSVFLWAWIMGIVYFMAGFPEGIFGARAVEDHLSPGEELIFIASKIVVIVSYPFFMRGFVALGKETGHQLLPMVSYLMMLALPVFSLFEIIAQLMGYNILGVVILEGMSMGVLHLVFGYCLFTSEREFGRLGVIAGALEVLAGLTFVTVVLGFVGLFLLIPIEILEIILLLKFYLRSSEVGFGGTVQKV